MKFVRNSQTASAMKNIRLTASGNKYLLVKDKIGCARGAIIPEADRLILAGKLLNHRQGTVSDSYSLSMEEWLERYGRLLAAEKGA